MPYKVMVRHGSPFQIEFPKTKKVEKEIVKFERTKEGALFCRPKSILFLTKDEYDFIAKDPINSKKFVFFGEIKQRVVQKEKKEQAKVIQGLPVPVKPGQKSKERGIVLHSGEGDIVPSE
jgi:hypothetical protein